MSHRWIIRRYKEDAIIVSENVGMQAKAAWDAGTPVIHLPGNISVSNGSISAIEETFETDTLMQAIGSGLLSERVAPIFNPEGDVVTNWYKVAISAQMWEKNFAKHLNYYKLIDSENRLWAAVRLPEYSGLYERSREYMRCDDSESDKLWRMSGA